MRIMVFGTFDDLHPGHRYLLTKATERAGDGKLCIIVGRDDNVMKIKGRAPLQSQEARMAAIQEAFPNANVMLGHETDFMARIRELQPDLILLGYDQRMPPGVTEESLGVPVERVDGFETDIHKSSLRRQMPDQAGKE